MNPFDLRFSEFVEHFSKIDRRLREFERSAGFVLEANAFHQPCRLLRKAGNPYLLIDISIDVDWKATEFHEDIAHSVSSIAYYCPEERSQWVWKYSEYIVHSRPFSEIDATLEQLLAQAVHLLNGWTVADIIDKGQRVENFERFL